MKAANAGRAQALCIVDEMVRCGMRHACLSPGSRSTPMALALAEREEISLHVLIDERSASFMALGIAKESRRPVAMVTTSGTAAANCLPAVVEAHHGGVALVMLTADRPPELRDTGAGQTIDQIKLYGSFTRWFCEMGVAEPRADSAPYWRSVAARACHTAAGRQPGPVHLNLAFRDPLIDVADDAGFPFPLDGREGGRPWREAEFSRLLPSEQVIDELAQDVQDCPRGLVVAGTGDYPGGPVAALATAAGWPLIAEATSNARMGANAVCSYDALVRNRNFIRDLRPDMVLTIGSPGISRGLAAMLDAGVPQTRIDPDRRWHDAGRVAARFIQADPAALGEELIKRIGGRPDNPWTIRWLEAGQQAGRAIDDLLDGLKDPSEPAISRDLARLLPDGSNLAVASSMPVRDLDWFMAPREGLRVLANRGANGIDGFVATTLGISASTDRPTCGLLGDLAFIHDANALMAASPGGLNAVLLVINNDGGGIFSFLPQAGSQYFEKLFGTPHGLEIEKIASLHGCGYSRLEKPGDLADLLRQAREDRGVQVIEARTNRSANAQLHNKIWAAASAAVGD